MIHYSEYENYAQRCYKKIFVKFLYLECKVDEVENLIGSKLEGRSIVDHDIKYIENIFF